MKESKGKGEGGGGGGELSDNYTLHVIGAGV